MVYFNEQNSTCYSQAISHDSMPNACNVDLCNFRDQISYVPDHLETPYFITL